MTLPLILLRLDEPDGVAPSDSAGNLDDLGIEAGIVAPTSIATFTGRGRSFVRASSNGLLAADIDGRDTINQRDLTIQAIVAPTLTGAAGPHTILARGINDGTSSERYAYGLEIEESATAGLVEVRLFWQDGAGAIKTQPPGVYSHPGDGKAVLLTATRRWESSSRVVVRYYVGAEMIAELVSSDGDIAGGTTGRTSIGARKAAGAWGRFLNGALDELLVLPVELSQDEIRQTWDRLTVHQPDRVGAIIESTPVGLGWGRDASSYDGRRWKLIGQAFGLVTARIEAFRDLFLPDRATLEQIARWERMCGLVPKPRDSLDVRRARVLGYLARDEGFSLAAIRASMAEVLDSDPDDLQIIEFTNERRDDFATLDTDHRWIAGTVGTFTSSGGGVAAHVDAGASIPIESAAAHLRSAIDQGVVESVVSDAAFEIFVAAKLSTWSIPDNTGIGVYLRAAPFGNLLWFGVYKLGGGAAQIGYRYVFDGVPGAFTSIAAAPGAGPLWLRMRVVPDPGGPAVTFSRSTAGEFSGFTSTTVLLGAAARSYFSAGLLAIATNATATAGAIDATFDDFVTWCPMGLSPFHWYVFRGPGGNPDIAGARLLARKRKPAHTYASVTQDASIIAGVGLCGTGPI